MNNSHWFFIFLIGIFLNLTLAFSVRECAYYDGMCGHACGDEKLKTTINESNSIECICTKNRVTLKK